MKRIRIALLLVAALPLLAISSCDKAKSARDAIATASGTIAFAQQQCAKVPAQAFCKLVPKSVAAENLAIDALETYCGFTPATPAGTACVAVASAKAGLDTALANLSQSTSDIKALGGGK